MCGRYFVAIDDAELNDIIKAAERSIAEQYKSVASLRTFAGGEVFPGTDVPALIRGREARFLKWGIPNMQGGRVYINARVESAAKLKMFAESFALRRCLIPASGYYEWAASRGGQKNKMKYEFTLPNRETMYMAGIYTNDGKFAILTRDAPLKLKEIHDRMPVIIPKHLLEVWLDSDPKVAGQAVTELEFSPVVSGNAAQLSLF